MGGRPRTLKDKDITAAKALLADASISVEEVAARLMCPSLPSTVICQVGGAALKIIRGQRPEHTKGQVALSVL